ncbi:TonB-dependent receptor [Salinibacter ruber]|uniref:TonB-dependent receptor n=1 Tax=Salinibacter ruber TaxID=146919 RepID=UPI002072C3E5|nr:TonB-dependent receptor [Salinibacter ruber]
MLLGLMPLGAMAQGTGAVTGTVVDAADGTPLVGATVRLRAAAAPTVVRRGVTGETGTYQLDRIRPGRYVLEVTSLGYQRRHVHVTMEVGESRSVDVELRRDAFGLETIVEAPSRTRQRLLEAPASTTVLEPARIRREATTSSVEALRAAEGVDVAQTGIDRREVALRGFNSAVSAGPHVRTDHREARAPALGLNLYSVMPNTTLDLDRIEAVQGPAGALYGTGVDGGVLHFVMRDPFRDPGTSFALSGGSRRYLNAQFRQAGVLGGAVGYKFTGQWGRADEWGLDPDNARDAAELGRYRVYEDPESPALEGRNFVVRDVDGDGSAEAQLRREDRYRRYNVNGLLTYRFDRTTSLSLRGGYASLTSPLQSPIGTLQASNLGYTYGQLRLDAGDLSAQVGLDRNLSGDGTYLYRTGNAITDEGTRVDGRMQYAFGVDRLNTEVLVGSALDVTRLQSVPGGTTPDEEAFSTFGTYLQTITPLAPSVSLTLAGRADFLSAREEVQFSPRAALVYTPAPKHALRVSYNRTASVPSASPLLQLAPGVSAPPRATVTQTLEVGYKGQVADRLRIGVDGYYETRDDVFVPVGIPVEYQNGGAISYGGFDVSTELRVTDALTLFGTTSVVSDDSFEGGAGRGDIALNAPAFKVKGGVDCGLPHGMTIGATVHHVDDFPVRFGPYTGTVDAYTLLDVRLRSSLPAVPGLSVNVTAQNVLGNAHREFVGSPALGRMVVARLTYELPSP